MPTISMFYGIIIRMYCSPGEHNPPHIHAYYQKYMAIVDIRSCDITEGKLPQGKQNLFWHGLKFIKKNFWQIGN